MSFVSVCKNIIASNNKRKWVEDLEKEAEKLIKFLKEESS